MKKSFHVAFAIQAGCSFFALLFLAVGGSDRDRFSPKDQADEIVEILKSGQYERIYPLLSSMDREAALYWSAKEEDDFLHKRRRWEQTHGLSVPGADFEVSIHMYLSELLGTNPALAVERLTRLAFFQCERRLGDVAEAGYLLQVPAMDQTIVIPLRLTFVREASGWKLCFILSNLRSAFNLDPSLSSSLVDTLDLLLGKRPQAKSSSFTRSQPPAPLAPRGENDFQTAQGKDLFILLRSWALSGNPRYVALRKKQLEDQDHVRFEALSPELESLCELGHAGQGPTGGAIETKISAPDQAERLFKVGMALPMGTLRALALKKFIDRFPDRPDLSAKTMLELAEAVKKVPDERISILEQLIKKYPGQKDIIPPVKAQLADLYWERLRWEDAARLGRELGQADRLEAELKMARLASPPRLVYSRPKKDDEENEQTVDFAFDDQGGIHFLREWLETKSALYGDRDSLYVQHTMIDSYGPDGKPRGKRFHQVFEEENRPNALRIVDGRTYLVFDKLKPAHDAQGKETFGVSDSRLWEIEDGVVIGEYVLEGDRLAPALESSGRKLELTPAMFHALFPASSLVAHGQELCREVGKLVSPKFEGSYLFLSQLKPIPGTEDQWLVIKDVRGNAVVKAGPGGKSFLVSEPPVTTSCFEIGPQFEIDAIGNLFVFDQHNKRILRFDPLGKLLGVESCDTPEKFTVEDRDADGNFYIMPDISTGHGRPRIEKLNASCQRVGSFAFGVAWWDIREVDFPRALAGYGKNLLVATEQEIMELDLEGKGNVLSRYLLPRKSTNIDILVAPSGETYLRIDKELYRFEGPDFKQLADFAKILPEEDASEKITKSVIAGLDLIYLQLGANPKRVYQYHIKEGWLKPAAAFDKLIDSSLEKIAVDSSGAMWLHLWENKKNKKILVRLSPDGEEKASISSNCVIPGLWAKDAVTDEDGNILVLDNTNDRLVWYSPSGEYLEERNYGGFFPKISFYFSRLKFSPSGRLFLWGSRPVGYKSEEVLIGFDLSPR